MLAKHINELVIAEPVIYQEGDKHIVVDLPGMQDMVRAQQILGATATLEFRLVKSIANQAETPIEVPVGKRYTYQGHALVLDRQVALTGNAITNALAALDEAGHPALNITLGSREARYFYQLSAEHIGRYLAILSVEMRPIQQGMKDNSKISIQKNERIIIIARITSPLGKRFQITGLAEKEAMNLALLLRAGALPTPVYIAEQTIVGPQLGIENIQSGLNAIVVGVLLSILFMAFYYQAFGWIANITLLINIILLVALASVCRVTLTWSGIAGILLTVALSLDAEALIFERIREELRRSNAPQTSIALGYACALFAVGTGAIKGFALILMLGVCTSLMSPVYFSRALVNYYYREKSVKTLSIGI